MKNHYEVRERHTISNGVKVWVFPDRQVGKEFDFKDLEDAIKFIQKCE